MLPIRAARAPSSRLAGPAPSCRGVLDGRLLLALVPLVLAAPRLACGGAEERSWSLLADDGVRIHGTSLGDASQSRAGVIFLHGEPELRREELPAWLNELSEHRRVHVFDRRASGPPMGTLSAGAGARAELGASLASERQLRDVDQVLEFLDLQRIALVGHSSGCVDAVLYAASRPERVERLVLLAPAALVGNGTAEELADLCPALSRVAAPTLVVHAGADPVAASISEVWRGAIPRARRTVLAGESSSFDHEPGAVAERVLAFLDADLGAQREGVLAVVREAGAASPLHGVVIVHEGDGEVFAGSLGEGADLDAKFRIASLTKLFTQAAILRLVDQRRIDLDAPLARYRPHADPALAPRITLRQLLAMRSGLPRELSDDSATSGVEYDEEGMAGPFLDALRLELEFEPGTKEAYSNVAYWFLGAVIEAETGETFEGAVRTLVLTPLGLEDTGFGRDEIGTGEHVAGHERDASGALVPLASIPIRQRYSSGGMYATPGDMARFFRAAASEGFLEEGSRALLLDAFAEPRAGERALRGNGHVPGFTHMIRYTPSEGRLVLLMTDVDITSPAPLLALQEKLVAALTGAPPKGEPGVKVIEVRSARDGLPDTPLARAVTTWLEAVASGDGERIYEIRKQQLPPGDSPTAGLRDFSNQIAGMKRTLGGFDLIGYQEREGGVLFVVVRGKRGEARFTFTPDEATRAYVKDIDIDVHPER